MSGWYVIRRTYRVEDLVYVKASSAAEASRRAKDGEYEDATAAEAISVTRYGRPQRKAFEDLPADLQFYEGDDEH